MNSNHKARVRGYLLGILTDDEARAFEEEYFANRSFLLEVRAAEAGLIADYITGRLVPGDRESFERRCVQLPDLQRRVDKFRKQIELQRGGASRLLGWTLAVAALLIVAAGTATLVYRQRTSQQAALPPPAPAAQRVIDVFLSPGVSMGEGREVQVALPPNSKVELVLNLPGQVSGLSVPVSVSLIGAEGALRQVWESPGPIESKAAQNGQTLALELNSELLQPGDYAVRAGTLADTIHKTFLFRVLRGQ